MIALRPTRRQHRRIAPARLPCGRPAPVTRRALVGPGRDVVEAVVTRASRPPCLPRAGWIVVGQLDSVGISVHHLN